MSAGPILACLLSATLIAPPSTTTTAAPTTTAAEPDREDTASSEPDPPTDDAPADDAPADDAPADDAPADDAPADDAPGDDAPADDAPADDAPADDAPADDEPDADESPAPEAANPDEPPRPLPPASAAPGDEPNDRKNTTRARRPDNVERLLLGGGAASWVIAGGLFAGMTYALVKMDEEASVSNDLNLEDSPRTAARLRAEDYNRLAWGLGVPGAIYATTGTVLLLLALRDRRRTSSAARLAPSVGPRFTGASLSGRF